jgi:arylsulfatase A-like enzyme
MTMLTGLWPTQHAVVEDNQKLGPGVPMIQELLREQGWVTGGFVSTFYVSKHYGFGRGFKFFQDYRIGEHNNLLHQVRADKVVHDAMEWAQKQPKGKPIFLFLHLYDVHYPYMPPEGFAEKFNPAHPLEDVVYKNYDYYLKNPPSPQQLEMLEGQYDECLASVDAQLNWLHQQWSRSGRKVDWVVTADHGEEFGERGSWGHAHTLYPEVLDIPMIAEGPDFPAGKRTEEVGHIDLAPTFAAIAGQAWNGPGSDLRNPIGERNFLAETSRFNSARISLERRGERLDLDRANRREERYDRRADPGEKNPLNLENGEMRAELLKEMGEPCTLLTGVLESRASLWEGTGWVEKVDASGGAQTFGLYPPDASYQVNGGASDRWDPRVKCRWSTTEEKLDPQTQEQLQQLGYLQDQNLP